MKAAAQPTQETSRHGQVENDLVGYEERRNIESFKQDLSCSLSLLAEINLITTKSSRAAASK
jgi:hypothetical protein